MRRWLADRLVLMLFYGWFMLKNAQEKAIQGHNIQPKPPTVSARSLVPPTLGLLLGLATIRWAIRCRARSQALSTTA